MARQKPDNILNSGQQLFSRNGPRHVEERGGSGPSPAPPPPPVPPLRNNSEAPRNAIDNFILARLEQEQLAPSPEADRRTLIRRLSLDLAGLPPKPEEAEAFVQSRDPRPYEKLVDPLLHARHSG